MSMLRMRVVLALSALARMGALRSRIRVTSRQLGEVLGVSQQSASRRLIELSERGLVERTVERRGQSIRITPEGEGLLYADWVRYRGMFQEGEERGISLRGRVVSGMGEGRYYMSLAGYRRQFRERLGVDPYPGTLNVRLRSADIPHLHALREFPGISLEGFTDHGRTFGGATLHDASISGVRCWVILPVRGHYSDTLEVISETYLRGSLSLCDGSEVSILVAVG